MHYDIGDTIEYMSRAGARTIKVLRKWNTAPFYEEYGPGFDGTMIHDDKMLVWGFDSDIISVLEA